MGKQDIIARILSDAEGEAEAAEAQARESAEQIRAEAESRAEALKAETEAELAVRAKRISEGKAAAARLDCAKLLLAEKRRVLDEVYARALSQLLSLGEHEALALYGKLLAAYAEEGETVVFAEGFAYAAKAAQLPVVKERGLTVAGERAPIAGGFLLRGKKCDKDVSFGALLLADREEHQAELAARIFR